ncbi:hypothetical protein ACGFW5_07780 [Streptomyces sp. NPDC048416]|uniref:hypothetical protein n=1 Tax=Streptomyces sp. NPDC048416 TaxID=3365546 RepID=UPI00371A00ED
MNVTPATTETDAETDAETEPTTDAGTKGASTTKAASTAKGASTTKDGATVGGASAEAAPATTGAAGTPDARGTEEPSLEDGHEDAHEDAHEDDREEGFEDEGRRDGDPVPARAAFGAGAAAVVAGALGAVSLSGTWMGKTLSERATLIGQIKTSQSGTAAQQIQEIYGNSWHTTAVVNGVFALLALIVGAVVLARPAFGTPGRSEQPVWVKAVALAGVVLGVIGLLISVGMYLDLFAAMPSTKG